MEWLKDILFLDFFEFITYKYNFLYIFFLFILFEICSSLHLELGKHEADWFYWICSKLISLLFAFLSAVILWDGIIRFTSLVCMGDKCF